MIDTTKDDPRNQLMADLRAVIADAEELLKATTGVTGDRIASVRAHAQETLKSARQRLTELDDSVATQAKEAVRTVDEYVREHPWQAAGIAALAGLLLGVSVSRR
jgi:ElaB/YqjD/DUF883 family membrane-anchored ribosome-binding protein